MTESPQVITIDGPAASGKSTIGKLVAERLGFVYLDTGAMYRAVTLAALQRGVDTNDAMAVSDIARHVRLDLRTPTLEEADGRQYTVLLDGEDVTWEIRAPRVDRHVSAVAAHGGVREAMVAQQQRIGQQGAVVMVGRDIGTVVMPDAPLKIYLDASLEERAHRRYLEAVARGERLDYEQLLAAMRKRDAYDGSRDHSPMRAAADAIQLSSTGLSISEVVDAVLVLAAERLRRPVTG
ncbi:MAG: (d)CMP kinase [Anaerolineales bacterium]|nr:(d)CMP kinase [Anaerolineales bacterium]MCB9127241.1 (d)CMP kinase [Ardenticatenales bacterium]MCB9172928.1 (d)CMP kinase [Ardenticatenales bacterium]